MTSIVATSDPDAEGGLTGAHLLVVFVCALGFGFDLAEVSLGGALAPIFAAAPYRLAPGALGWLVSAVYVGSILGAPAGGLLWARLGYRRTLGSLAAWLAITSLAAALCASPAQLAWIRLLSGLALGAYPPLVIAYIREVTPPRRRGLTLFGVCAIAYLVPPAAIFALRTLTAAQPLGIEGWRWLFLLGAAAGLAAALGGFRLPEVHGTRRATGQVAGHPSHGRRRDLARRLAFIGALYFLIPWATVGLPMVTGPALLSRGVNLSDTLAYVAAAAAGPAISTLAIGLFVDRLPRRGVMAICGLLMLAGVAAFFTLPAPAAMAAAAIVVSALGSTYMAAMTLFGAELFPPSHAPWATALAWTGNRVGAALAPLVLLTLVQGGRASAVVSIIGLALAAGVSLLVLAPEPWRSRT